MNALSTLLHRAYTLTSDWANFHKEISYLHQYFTNNCFPSKLFYKQVKKFMNKVYLPKQDSPNVPKLPVYASVPFIHNKAFYHELHTIINNYIPAIELKLIPINPLSIGSLFKSKERLDSLMTSKIVYLFTCPRCDLGRYVGLSRRLLKVRIDAHKGVSFRTGNKITNPEYSSIRNHAKKCKHDIQYTDFKIIGRAKTENQLKILESLLIKQLVPELNNQTTSTPLHLSWVFFEARQTLDLTQSPAFIWIGILVYVLKRSICCY